MTPNSKLRSVNTKFWDDKYVIDLDPIEKLLFLYFLTNPLTTLAGVYEISLRRIAFDTGIDKDMVLKILDRFERDKKIYYRDSFVILVNYRKNQKFTSKMEINVQNTILSLPEGVASFYKKVVNLAENTLSIAYPYPIDKVKVKVKEESEIESESEAKAEGSLNHQSLIDENSFSITYDSLMPKDFKNESEIRKAIKTLADHIPIDSFNLGNETTLTKMVMNPESPIKANEAFYIVYKLACEYPSLETKKKNAQYFVSVIKKRINDKAIKLREKLAKEKKRTELRNGNTNREAWNGLLTGKKNNKGLEQIGSMMQETIQELTK